MNPNQNSNDNQDPNNNTELINPTIPQSNIQPPSSQTPIVNQENLQVVSEGLGQQTQQRNKKDFLLAFLLSYVFGFWGVDRFYLGYVGTGIVKLLTFGGLGVWVFIDVILILTGYLKEKGGAELNNRDKYIKPVLIFFLIATIASMVFGGLTYSRTIQKFDEMTRDHQAQVNTKNDPLINTIDSEDYDYQKNKTVIFQQPYNVAGWENDVIDNTQGLYRYVQTDGSCQVSLLQSKGAIDAKSTGYTPRNSSLDYIHATISRYGIKEYNNEKTQDIGVKMSNNSDFVLFASEKLSYKGNDNKNYTLEIGTRWFGDVELAIIKACESSDWSGSQKSLEEFISKISVYSY